MMNEDEKTSLICRFLDWLYNEHELVVAKQAEDGWKKARDLGLGPIQLAEDFLNTEEE